MTTSIKTMISVAALIIIGFILYTIMFKKNAATDIQSIKTNVQSGQYDFDEGTKLMNKEQYAEAEKHFVALIKNKSVLSKESYINTLINLGVCCVNQNKIIEAKKYWKEAADMGDKDAAENLKKLDR